MNKEELKPFDLSPQEEANRAIRVELMKPLYPKDPVIEEHRLEYEADKPKIIKICEIKGRFGLGKIKIDSFNFFGIFKKKVK